MQTVTIIAGGIVLYCTVLYCGHHLTSRCSHPARPSANFHPPTHWLLFYGTLHISYYRWKVPQGCSIFLVIKSPEKRRIRVIQVKNKFSSREWRQTGGRGAGRVMERRVSSYTSRADGEMVTPPARGHHNVLRKLQTMDRPDLLLCQSGNLPGKWGKRAAVTVTVTNIISSHQSVSWCRFIPFKMIFLLLISGLKWPQYTQSQCSTKHYWYLLDICQKDPDKIFTKPDNWLSISLWL